MATLWKRKSFFEIEKFRDNIKSVMDNLTENITNWETEYCDEDGEIEDDVYSISSRTKLLRFLKGTDDDITPRVVRRSFGKKLEEEIRIILVEHYDIEDIKKIIEEFLIPPLTGIVLEYLSGKYS